MAGSPSGEQGKVTWSDGPCVGQMQTLVLNSPGFPPPTPPPSCFHNFSSSLVAPRGWSRGRGEERSRITLILTLSWPLRRWTVLPFPQLLSFLSNKMRAMGLCVRRLEVFWFCTGTPGGGVFARVDKVELSSNYLITLGTQ